MNRLPVWIKPLGLVVAFLALIPFAVIAKARVTLTGEPRIHVIRDMDNQAYYKAQSENELFADGRAMRPPVPGTVARGEAELDDHLYRGLGPDGKFVDAFPGDVKVDRALLERGRERYTIYCAVCHGHGGYGDGIIHQRAMELVNKGRAGMEWIPPTNLHTLPDYKAGQMVHVITNGVRNMPPYGAQVSVSDRWAIAAYVKALQRSQQTERP
jgi:mono/diheme cytochrome c family protein